jgi:hypothetical protein
MIALFSACHSSPVLRFSAFIEIDQIGERNDVGAALDTVPLLESVEYRGCVIVPSKFGNEAVPNNKVTLIEPSALFETPLQYFFVAPSSEHPLAKIVVFNS